MAIYRPSLQQYDIHTWFSAYSVQVVPAEEDHPSSTQVPLENAVEPALVDAGANMPAPPLPTRPSRKEERPPLPPTRASELLMYDIPRTVAPPPHLGQWAHAPVLAQREAKAYCSGSGREYRGYPFLRLFADEAVAIMHEAGHPADPHMLPDGEQHLADALVLVRIDGDRGQTVGWVWESSLRVPCCRNFYGMLRFEEEIEPLHVEPAPATMTSSTIGSESGGDDHPNAPYWPPTRQPILLPATLPLRWMTKLA
ncbi:hypothetical protein FA95DRAFT_1555716, partial [Auriscalpium vulgare]